MAKICPMNGCKGKEGMCMHDKMMVIIVLIVIVFFIITFGRNSQTNNLTENTSSNQTAEVNPNAESYESYAPEKLAFAETGNVVLFFRASWCPSCRALDKDINENLGAIPTDLKILDVDYDNSQELKQKYGVTTQHTLVQVDKDGNMISKWSGSPTLSSLVSQIK